MQTDDFSKFHEGISGVMGFYGKGVSTFALDVWWNALKGYDLAAVVDAFNRHLANPDAGQYAPKPADIIRMLQGSTQDSALRAWAKVDKAVRHVGTYADVVFDDPLIHRVIQDMGGWIGFGTKNEDEWPFVAKEFENRYRGFRVRSEIPEYPAKLMGIATAHNEKQGFKADAPVLIGNELKARQVLNGGTDKPSIGFKRLSDAVEQPEMKQLRSVG
ncbi:DUF6475 domain-containing protein [Nitrosovibrio sp. Nv4]|uniref:DUF6475 domain-containing protein n=1 Tax=Nitrosovibrio sp. Nv4 TaxID=1945880 RepID=UPI000BCE46F7|nr:DUF6475 domain-containing protein [Nitrosovibrio sp. Nv4]SOD42399.1 hypothetical protein SAMN06298226_2738 [Nitrosovibrio sp. Nv4]